MAYPTDKEEFRRVVNQDLPAVEGDIVDEDDQNLPADFLERLQDTFGYGIKMGYATVKTFFDYVVTQIALIAGKVSKTGDTMTGDLHLQLDATCSSKIYFETTATQNTHWLFLTSSSIEFNTNTSANYFWRINNNMRFKITNTNLTTYVTLQMNDRDIASCKNITQRGAADLKNETAGRGIILKTPDGTKYYKITINDAGNVITTLQP